MSQIQGIIAPVVTPLDSEERINRRVLEELVDQLVPDIDGLFVRGSSGEYPLLTQEDADLLLKTAVEVVDGRVPVIAGVGDTGTKRTLQGLESLAENGADVAAVSTPFYYQVEDQAALAAHFEAIADRAQIPILLYQIPQNTHNTLTPSAIHQLSLHDNITGVKDSSGDMFAFQQTLDARSDSFTVLQGREQLAAASLWLGADGIVSALANLAPGLLRALARAVAEGDRGEALGLQRRATHLAEVFDQGYWVSALKQALIELGHPVGPTARPLPSLSEDQCVAVRRLLQQAELTSGGSIR